jgi:peptide/nickel transport system substrate-binding protein
MRRSINRVVLLGALTAFIFLVLTFPTGNTPLAQGAEKMSPWVWTKENPKPFWWSWGKDYWPEDPVSGGIYKLAAPRYIGLMNPNHWPVNDWNAMTYFYDFLMYNDGNFRPTVLFMAESYKYLNPSTLVMKLRKGIKYHDGADFNAAALKIQVDYIKDKANGCWSRAWIAPVKSIEILDEFTVQFNFKQAWAGFAGIFATVPGFMISPKALENEMLLTKAKKIAGQAKKARKKANKAAKKDDKAKADKLAQKALAKEAEAKELAEKIKDIVSLDKRAVGSGKYMYDKASPGNFLRYKRNPNWWFGQSIGRPEMPYPDGVLITIIPDYSVQLANLRAGKINFMGIEPSYYDVVKDDPKIVTEFSTWPHVTAMRFNTMEGPCKDIRVRKAISHAIDRKALIAGVQFGLGTVAAGMYPAKHWAHNPAIKPVKYDPELSRKLLKEAGYEKGLVLKGYMSNLTYWQSLGEAVKAMLAQVGVDWKVESLDPTATSDRMKNAEYDFAAGGWAYIWDPDMMATGLYHPDGGFNYGRSNYPEAIALIDKGRNETNFKKRQLVYWELEKLIYDHYEDAWLWYPMNVGAYTKNVAGYNEKFSNVGLEGFYHSHPVWLSDGGKGNK